MRLPFRPKFLLWLGLSLGVVLGLALLAAVAASKMQVRRLRAELEQVQQAMAKGRLGLARKSLADLVERWPRNGEVLLLLGQCEEALGRPDRALAAWALVPDSDSNFVRAAESQGSLLINLGRYAPAESLLFEGPRDGPRNGPISAPAHDRPAVPAGGSVRRSERGARCRMGLRPQPE